MDKTVDYYYLKLSLTYLVCKENFHFLITIIEYTTIYTNILLSVTLLIYKNYDNSSNFLYYCSFYNIMKLHIKFNQIIPLIFFIMIIVFMFLFLCTVYSLKGFFP